MWALAPSLIAFAAAALVVAWTGTRLSAIADRLADRLELGEAFVGAVFLGAVTSLSGLVTTVTAGLDGFPELAASNAIGGIAVQTAWIALADLSYRPANLEHAAASVPNLTNAVLLIALLTLPLLAALLPAVSVLDVHPATLGIFVVYIYGLRLVRQAQKRPMWLPLRTKTTKEDVADEESARGPSTTRLWLQFALFASMVAVAGWVIARAGESIVVHTGLAEAAVGALVTGASTSLPELVVSVAAVRRGALTLAVGNIVGGNGFDVLQLAAADVAYREGSLYHAVGAKVPFLIVLTLLMTAVLVLGLVRREERGVANIGAEGVTILVLYVLGVIALFVG